MANAKAELGQAEKNATRMIKRNRRLAISCCIALRDSALRRLGKIEGQIEGGIAQGIGMALMEEYIAGRTDNLHDYLIPTIGDIPPITTYIIEDAEPIAPYGAKGVGEPALIATAPAIFGAIRQATGVRVDVAPCTPDRLRQRIKAQKA